MTESFTAIFWPSDKISGFGNIVFAPGDITSALDLDKNVATKSEFISIQNSILNNIFISEIANRPPISTEFHDCLFVTNPTEVTKTQALNT